MDPGIPPIFVLYVASLCLEIAYLPICAEIASSNGDSQGDAEDADVDTEYFFANHKFHPRVRQDEQVGIHTH